MQWLKKSASDLVKANQPHVAFPLDFPSAVSVFFEKVQKCVHRTSLLSFLPQSTFQTFSSMFVDIYIEKTNYHKQNKRSSHFISVLTKWKEEEFRINSVLHYHFIKILIKTKYGVNS